MATTVPQLQLLYSPPELTVLAQAISKLDQGALLWDTFMPRQDVDSVELMDVTTLDYRPAADRREWNARGRIVPLAAPARRQVSIVPIEARQTIDEKEMQSLGERTSMNWQTVADIMSASLPGRVEVLTQACYRRLDVDAMSAWALGSITQRNPENAAQTYAASFGFSATRYTTAGTAWNVVANAYSAFLTWLTSAEDLVGQVEGVMLRQATFNEILLDAPQLPNQVTMTRSMLADRVSQDLGQPFQFYINENSVDVFDDGGLTYTRTKVWPAQRVAAIPVGKTVGRSAFAPVMRAMEYAGQANAPQGIDVRGVTVYYDGANSGRELLIEAQVNAIPLPDEQKCAVHNAGV